MYPTLNGKTSIHKSLDDSDRPQTHIISPGMSDKGKLVGGVVVKLQVCIFNQCTLFCLPLEIIDWSLVT